MELLEGLPWMDVPVGRDHGNNYSICGDNAWASGYCVATIGVTVGRPKSAMNEPARPVRWILDTAPALWAVAFLASCEGIVSRYRTAPLTDTMVAEAASGYR